MDHDPDGYALQQKILTSIWIYKVLYLYPGAATLLFGEKIK